LGLDVHAETIAVAVAETDGEVRSLGTIPNRAESIRKMIKKLGPAEKLRACMKQVDGLCRVLAAAESGIQCEVVAPTLVPVKAVNRVRRIDGTLRVGTLLSLRRSDGGMGSVKVRIVPGERLGDKRRACDRPVLRITCAQPLLPSQFTSAGSG